MGSVYAALLADAGNQVSVVDTWPEHVQAIEAGGLRVEGASGDRVVKNIKAAMHLRNTQAAELIVLATKADGVAAACEAIQDQLDGGTQVLTMQNGIGAADIAAAKLPSESLLVGIAKGFGASITSPGHAHHHAMAEIRIGEVGGGDTGRGRKIARVWADAGFNAHFYADIDRLIWEKFICNVTLSAPCTVFDKTVREIRHDPELWRIALGCGLEAYNVGLASGIAFDLDDASAYLTDYAESLGDAHPSMTLDHHAGRRSEIDFINGRVPILGRPLDVATPYNDAMSAVIRDRESRFQT